MEKDRSNRNGYTGPERRVEALQRENEALAQQVKRLIRAEGKLYEYQQQLDSRVKEYKALYELSRKLSGTLDIKELFRQTVEFVIQQLEYERVILLRRKEKPVYRVCAFDGYYDSAEREAVARFSIGASAACLANLLPGKEHLVCTAGSDSPAFASCRHKLHMDEFIVAPLGHDQPPNAILIVGNSADNAMFYRRVEDNPAALLGIGNLVGLVSSLLDMHVFFERMTRARKKELVAEGKYRGIFENAAEGIYRRSPDGTYLDANPALAHMLGYASPQELMSEVTDICHQLYVDQSRHNELMREVSTKGQAEGFETQMYRKDGSAIWVSLSIREVRDPHGRVLCYEGISEEITERKAAEAALKESEQRYRQLSEALEQRVREAVDELRQKDKMLIMQGRQAVMGEMLSNIAHQWRQPLNLLALLLQDLQLTHKTAGLAEGYLEQSVKRSMDVIRQMSRTIDDFRYFFRPDREKLEFRVREPLDRALALLDGSLAVHDIRTEVVQSGDPTVEGYLGEFVQVLLNILINARDALAATRPANPQISIKVFTDGDRTIVSIADNAGGIAEGIKDKIFDPYFTTKGPEQGTGIGLYMCKTIIEKSMNGTITARNTEDGAEFVIALPRNLRGLSG